MKKIALLWCVVFIAAAISIASTHELLISPIWVVNALAGVYLLRLRKQISHPIWMLAFSFSSVFIASYCFDMTKAVSTKALLSVLGAIQIQSFVYFYFYIGLKLKNFKYKNTALLALPIILSSLVGSVLFMLLMNVGENYYEFIDYFLEQFATGLAVVCLLKGWQQWKGIQWNHYFVLASASLAQYLISMDQIFHSCLILPLVMCFYALNHALKEFCWLIGLLVLFCTMYVSLPLAGEYWSASEVPMLSRLSAYRLSLGLYLVIFLFICEMHLINRRLYHALARVTFHDELTQLRTRRFLKDLLPKNPFEKGSGILLDLDNFKQVNDTYGHHVGDLVLQHMSKLLLDLCPSSAVVSRWGGEEFFLLLPDYDAKACLALCQQILDECQRRPFPYGDDLLTLTFSMGATSFEYFTMENYSKVLQQMDGCLYEAKAKGKNQLIYASVA